MIERRNDQTATRGAHLLKDLVEKKIRKVFVNSLRIIEMKWGKNFDGYEEIRAEILRNGNDAVRDARKLISERFNVEEISDVETVVFKNNEERK